MAVEPSTASLHDRARELARIAGRLAEARTGDGSLTVIEGPAGIGKTSLMKGLERDAGTATWHDVVYAGGRFTGR